MLGATAFLICVLLAPISGIALATGLVRRGTIAVHTFYAHRAGRICGRGWKLALGIVGAGVAGSAIGSQLVVGGEGFGVVQALVCLQLGQLGVVGFDGVRVRGGHWAGLVSRDQAPWRTALRVLVGLAPLVVLVVGVVSRGAYPFLSGWVGTALVLIPAVSAIGLGVVLGRRAADFGRWYLARQAWHGGLVAAYSVVIPILAVRSVMSDLITSLLSRSTEFLSVGSVVVAGCTAVAVVGWILHLGRLAVLPRVVPTASVNDQRSTRAGSSGVLGTT